jgi:hypothetical protein
VVPAAGRGEVGFQDRPRNIFETQTAIGEVAFQRRQLDDCVEDRTMPVALNVSNSAFTAAQGKVQIVFSERSRPSFLLIWGRQHRAGRVKNSRKSAIRRRVLGRGRRQNVSPIKERPNRLHLAKSSLI